MQDAKRWATSTSVTAGEETTKRKRSTIAVRLKAKL